jgi:hypothetical protein
MRSIAQHGTAILDGQPGGSRYRVVSETEGRHIADGLRDLGAGQLVEFSAVLIVARGNGAV